MSNSDPFGFDISAASDKKRRAKGRRGTSGAFETSTRRWDQEGAAAGTALGAGGADDPPASGCRTGWGCAPAGCTACPVTSLPRR